MPLQDIGPRGYHQAQAAATLSFTPQYDRAAVITKILVDKVSAGDIWRVTCGTREIAAFDIQTYGNQQPLAGPYSGYPKNNDLFALVNSFDSYQLSYPVPQAMTLTIASDGGATANILIEFAEMSPGEISPGMYNHPLGTRFILPLVGYRAATTAAVGEVALDTQVGPKWFPNLFVDGMLPPKWQFTILALFLEGGGRNTYSGSADVQSVTSYFAVIRDGQRLFTRDALGGIPLVGQASATGSANTVVGTDTTPNPPFQESDWFNYSDLKMPLRLAEGDTSQIRLNLTGAATGGADYSHMRQLLLCDVRTPG